MEWNGAQIGELKTPGIIYNFIHDTDFLHCPRYTRYISIKRSGQSRLDVLHILDNSDKKHLVTFLMS